MINGIALYLTMCSADAKYYGFLFHLNNDSTLSKSGVTMLRQLLHEVKSHPIILSKH